MSIKVEGFNQAEIRNYWNALSHDDRITLIANARARGFKCTVQTTELVIDPLPESACAGIESASSVILSLMDVPAESLPCGVLSALARAGVSTHTEAKQLLESATWAVRRARNRRTDMEGLKL